MTYVRMAVH